jgi:hypothetical protein
MSTKLDSLPDELQLAAANHVKYIQSLDTRKDEYDYWLTEHLRLNGVYWGLVALHLLGRPDALPRSETIDFVLSCQHDSGGFGAAPGHDAHMLYTVSAVQILAMVDAFDELEERGRGKAKVGECALSPYIHLPSLVHSLIHLLLHLKPNSTLTHPSQSLQTCRTVRQAPSQATSGARRTRASCTAPSTPSPSWDCCTSSTSTRQ